MLRGKVNGTITAEIQPKDATNVASYEWATADSVDGTFTPVADQTAATLTILPSMKDKYIKVTVKDTEGNSFESNVVGPAVLDKSGEITLSVQAGAQTDGTALTGDTLVLNYGSTLGTPASVIWYRNGAVQDIDTIEGGDISSASFNSTNKRVGGKLQSGEWYVSIQTTTGDVYVSNSIIVAEENQAVIKEFTIENDYETAAAAGLDFTATTSKAVATITMNKLYAGTFYVTAANTTSYTTAPTNTITTTDLRATANKVSKSKFTNAQAMANTATNYAVYYDDEETGEIHYKWVIDNAAITRGTEYVLAFDQDNIDTDDIGKATSKKENVNMSSPVVCPYLDAPASIVVSGFQKATSGSKTIKVSFVDSNGKPIEYIHSATAAAPGGTTTIYNHTVNKVEATATTLTTASCATVKGVSTYTYTASASNGEKGYVYATYKTNAGVFAKDSETLTSAVAEEAPYAADAIALEEDSADPTAAVVKFTNLKSKAVGTLYVLHGLTTSTDDAAKIAAQDLEGNAVKGKIEITGSTDKVTIPGVFAASDITGTTNNNDDFVAVYVPSDEDSYSRVTSAMVTLKQVPTSLAFTASKVTGIETNSGAITVDDATDIVKDQFDGTISVALDNTAVGAGIAGASGAGKTFEMTALKSEGTTKTATIKIEKGTANGKAKVTLTTYGRTGIAADDTGEVANESIFYAKVGTIYVVATKTATANKWTLTTSATAPTLG